MIFNKKILILTALILLSFIVLLILPILTTTYIHILLTTIFMYCILTLSWNIFCGPTKYISLGSTAFFGVGIYTAAIIGDKLPIILTIIIAGITSSILALIIGFTTLRLKGIYFAIFTFGLGEFLRYSIKWYEVNITSTLSRWVPVTEPTTAYYLMYAVLIITILISFVIKNSKIGLTLRSIGQSEEAAQHMGVNTTAVKIIFFTISCCFMGLAGAIIAGRWTYINPEIAFNANFSFIVVLMVLVGGITYQWGPLIGAVILTLISEYLTAFTYYYLILYGIILILIILFMPNGILGLINEKRIPQINIYRNIKKLFQ